MRHFHHDCQCRQEMEMNYIYPDPLKKGDTIGLITPSSSLMPGRLEAGIHYFEQKGFKVVDYMRK